MHPAFFLLVPFRSAFFAVRWALNKLEYTYLQPVKFRRAFMGMAVEMATHCSAIIMLNVMIITLKVFSLSHITGFEVVHVIR